MISIIDYGLGNLASVKKALDFLSINNAITSDFEFISQSDAIILPGVGSFYQGMYNLRERGLDIFLTDEVVNKKKKFLGICLGMQLVFESSEEALGVDGLGWISGVVKKIGAPGLRIPHMGWNNIKSRNANYIIKETDYYFIHSYHCIPNDSTLITSTVNYGTDIVASVRYDNISAMQFHPEKSQSAGLELLETIFK